jgi:hypothetical protein
MKIFKCIIPIIDQFCIKLPIRSEILSFQMQENNPCLWALVNEDNREEERFFKIYGTGNEIIDSRPMKFIGTVQINFMVWHLFEIINTNLLI